MPTPKSAVLDPQSLEELFAAHRITAALRPFLTEYLRNGRDGAAAYRKVHPNGQPKFAKVGAYRTLRQSKIRAFLTAYDGDLVPAVIDKIAEKTAITKAAVLRELARIGFANLEDFCIRDSTGQITSISLRNASREQMAAVKRVKMVEVTRPDGSVERTIDLALWDKIGAAQLIGTELGMFAKQKPQDDSEVVPPEVKEARERNRRLMLEMLEKMEQTPAK